VTDHSADATPASSRGPLWARAWAAAGMVSATRPPTIERGRQHRPVRPSVIPYQAFTLSPQIAIAPASSITAMAARRRARVSVTVGAAPGGTRSIGSTSRAGEGEGGVGRLDGVGEDHRSPRAVGQSGDVAGGLPSLEGAAGRGCAPTPNCRANPVTVRPAAVRVANAASSLGGSGCDIKVLGPVPCGRTPCGVSWGRLGVLAPRRPVLVSG
jgi:hypothetical protein